MGLEIKLFHPIEINTHQQQLRRNRRTVRHLLGPGARSVKGLTGRWPGPDHTSGWCEPLPVIKQRRRILL